MSHFQPPFTITAKIIHYISDIAEALGKLSVFYNKNDIHQDHENIVKNQIQNTLAIEGSDLTSPHINTPHRDDGSLVAEIVQEKNDIANTYNQLDNWDTNLCNDFLSAHKTLTLSRGSNAGHYRTSNVDKGKRLQMAPQALHIPQMMEELFSWLASSNQHPLIKSSVFHYELKFIHPFVDGNSRIGCIWQTQMLKQWNPLFTLIPIEGIVATSEEQYRAAISNSTETGDSCAFIEYILENVLRAVLTFSDSLSDKKPTPQQNPSTSNPQQTPQVKALINVLSQAGDSLNRKQLQVKLNLKDRKHFRERYLKPAIDAALIEMTIPDKPNSKLQKYRLV
ncbi:Fic family protein [Pseudoalteromonas aliena]|uniref:Fic family protein n=1 Tax=Pseudoalteromonas aliena TaxID=247523 RepID=UPI0024957B8A|nr:Fic family protein [Pseudoalteromonas aliena]